MRPYPDEVLRALQAGVAAHFAPELQSSYAKAQFAFSMLLFSVVARDYDTAVPDLVEANRAVRAILDDATPALAKIASEDARDLRDAIAALPPPATSLTLSDLRAEDLALRGALARLASLAEPAADDPALAPLRETRSKIIARITEDAKRRVVPILSA